MLGIKPKKTEELTKDALQFGKGHKNVLVMIADPKSDEIILTYNKKYSVSRVLKRIPILNIKKGIIKNILYQKDSREKDMAIAELLNILGGFIAKATGKFNENRDLNQEQRSDKKEQSN